MMDREKFVELCKESLDDKWSHGSKHHIGHKCPFCRNNIYAGCGLCGCPKEICSDFGDGGFIGVLKEKYGEDALVCDVSEEDLEKMRRLFLNRIDGCVEDSKT
jgi:hypothetical protein